MSYGIEIKHIQPPPTHLLIGRISDGNKPPHWYKVNVMLVRVTEEDGVKKSQTWQWTHPKGWTQPNAETYRLTRRDLTPLPEDYFVEARCPRCEEVMVDVGGLSSVCPNRKKQPAYPKPITDYYCEAPEGK